MKIKSYQTSPFRAQGVEKKVVTRRKDKGGNYVNRETGEILNVLDVKTEMIVDTDSEPFVKLFRNALKILPMLSKPSLTLLCHIMSNLPKNSEEILLPREVVISEVPTLKGNGWYRAIRQLISLGVLAQGKSPIHYWVNPNVIFNGRRTVTE